MGRHFKEGLDYFELDCQMDDKVKLIQAEFGLKGFAVVVKLYQKIYGERGYYCEWNEDTVLLFMSENGVAGEKNCIDEIVKACIRRDIFSKDIFDRYGVLTSSGIQKRYLNAVARRESVKMRNELLLVKIDQKNVSVDKNEINVDRNNENADRNAQSRVEKSIERKEINKEKKNVPSVRGKTASSMIEERAFPPELETAVKDWVQYKIEKKQGYKETGFRNLLNQIEKKLQEYGTGPVVDVIRNSMSSNYMGITWDKIRPAGSYAKRKGNRFNNFPQREYDYEDIEKQLLSK